MHLIGNICKNPKLSYKKETIGWAQPFAFNKFLTEPVLTHNYWVISTHCRVENEVVFGVQHLKAPLQFISLFSMFQPLGKSKRKSEQNSWFDLRCLDEKIQISYHSLRCLNIEWTSIFGPYLMLFQKIATLQQTSITRKGHVSWDNFLTL